MHFFQFIGRMIGKAISEKQYMECFFAKPLYKLMLGEDLVFEDFEDMDKGQFNSFVYILNEENVEEEELDFSIVKYFAGAKKEIELIEGGKGVNVTSENKKDYIEKLSFFEMYGQVKQQTQYFLKGFFEMVPRELISIFNYRELELLIAGLPDFDI